MTDSDFYDLSAIEEIARLFDKADTFAKEIEMFRSNISIPPVNELRYAGHHLTQALVAKDKTDFRDEVRKSKGHCQRSMYEASESGITHALDLVKGFREDYKDLIVSEIVPGHSGMRRKATKASEMLSRGRVDRDSAENQAEQYMETFRELRDIVETLDASRDDLNAKRVDGIKADRRFSIRIIVMIVVPALLAILGFLLKAN